MTTDLADIIGRLRSQGAVTPDEESRFRSMLPKIGFTAESPKTAKFKLDKLRALFNDIKTASEPATSDFSSRVKKLISMGATKEQIYKVYQSGGM